MGGQSASRASIKANGCCNGGTAQTHMLFSNLIQPMQSRRSVGIPLAHRFASRLPQVRGLCFALVGAALARRPLGWFWRWDRDRAPDGRGPRASISVRLGCVFQYYTDVERLKSFLDPINA